MTVGRSFYNKPLNPELVEIGKKIVAKCKGLPLAVKVLGGLLRFESDEWKWIDILDSELWELDEEEDQILPALRLSYDRMPPALKQCFMYFSLFPKDYTFYKDSMVSLLMSQGHCRSDGKVLEEGIGRGFLDDLLQRSILEYDPSSESKEALKMHDLVHDLAQSVAGEEFTRVDDGELCDLTGEVRHLSLVWSNSISNLNLLPLKKLKSLRTLLIMHRIGALTYNHINADVPNDLFRDLKALRTVDLSKARLGALPESIGNLKLLRYLNIGDADVKRLPESIFRLYNLQTPEINYGALEESPEAINELINLRHLLLNEGAYPKYLPSGIRHLTKLQTLTTIHVGRESRQFKIQDLKNLAHLKGRLMILNLKNVISVGEAEEANLKSKKDLKVLDLSWKCSDKLYCNTSHGQSSGESSKVSLLPADWFEERVLASLEPHTNLEEFIISYYGGIRFPRWIGDVSFSKLVKISLMNCQKCILLPPLGQLPSLMYLSMEPVLSLQKLCISYCYELETVVSLSELPSLEELSIRSSPQVQFRLHSSEDIITGNCPSLQEWCRRRDIDLELCRLTWQERIFQWRNSSEVTLR